MDFNPAEYATSGFRQEITPDEEIVAAIKAELIECESVGNTERAAGCRDALKALGLEVKQTAKKAAAPQKAVKE